MSDIRPFLATITAAQPAARPLASTLASVDTGPVTSPWSPQPTTPAAPAAPPPPEIDVAAIEAEARERGRADGLAETEKLRAQLQQAIEAFTAARAALVTPTAIKVATAAAAVVEAWSETAPPAELYSPIIHAWISKHEAPAVAHVPPAHKEAIEQLVGGAPITVIADASMSAGDIRLSSPTLELSHGWDQHLPELREAIAAALETR